MVGKLWWNLVFAFLGAAMVYVLSIGENTMPTTAIRSSATFALFFLILFLFRWALGFSVESRKEINSNHNDNLVNYDTDEGKSNATEHSSTADEEMLVHQTNGETDTQNELSEEEAKKTSEMIRSLLDDE